MSLSKTNIQLPVARAHILPNSVFILSFTISPFFARNPKQIIVSIHRKLCRNILSSLSLHILLFFSEIQWNSYQICVSTSSHHFSQQTCFIRSYQGFKVQRLQRQLLDATRYRRHFVECVLLLLYFWLGAFLFGFWCSPPPPPSSKDNVKTISTSPQANIQREKLNVHPLTEVTLEQRESESAS